MAEYNQRRRKKTDKHHRKGRGFGFFPTLLIVIMIVISVMYAISIFFNIKNVEAYGSSIYSGDKIKEASGIDEDDNLLFLDKLAVSSRIYAELPYIKDVKISRELPNTIIIEVTDRQAMAYFMRNGIMWIIDETGHVLQSRNTSSDAEEGLLPISGVNLLYPAAGDTFYLPESDSLIKEGILNFLSAIKAQEMEKDILNLHISGPFEARMNYKDRFTVIIPLNADIPAKLEAFKLVLNEFGNSDRGTIDMKSDEQIRFVRHVGDDPVWNISDAEEGGSITAERNDNEK